MLSHVDNYSSLKEILERAKDRIGDIDNEERVNEILKRVNERITKDISLSERRYVSYWDIAFSGGESVKIQHFKDFVEGIGYTVDNLLDIGSLSKGDTAFFYENPHACIGIHIILRVN